MKFKWLSIGCTATSIIIMLYLIFNGYTQLPLETANTLTTIEYLLGLFGFVFALYAKSTKKKWIILFSLTPIIIVLILLLFGIYFKVR
ncbi:hypothetical protein RW115_04565 [Macrococcus capreoli]